MNFLLLLVNGSDTSWQCIRSSLLIQHRSGIAFAVSLSFMGMLKECIKDPREILKFLCFSRSWSSQQRQLLSYLHSVLLNGERTVAYGSTSLLVYLLFSPLHLYLCREISKKNTMHNIGYRIDPLVQLPVATHMVQTRRRAAPHGDGNLVS